MVEYQIKRVLTACAFVSLAACSGAGGGTPPVEPPQAAPAAKAGAYVTFTMHWPAAKARIQPHYISPSTMSLVVEVNEDASLTQTFNSPSKGKSATQTVRIAAPAGRDDFVFTLWEKKGGKGEQLGQGEKSRKVVAGKPNKIGVSIDGVLASVGITPAPSQPYLIETSDATGTPFFTLVGDYAATFTIAPLDAGGNVIVAPGKIPTISLASSDPSFTVKPVKGKRNQYTVRPATWTQPGIHPSLVCRGHSTTGIVLTRYGIAQSPVTYVTYENTGTGSITAFNPAGKQVATPAGFTGLQDPTGITYDAVDHLLFVADRAAGKLYAFNQDGSPASGFRSPAVPGATGVIYDPASKHVYVTSATSNALEAFNATGSRVTLSGFSPLSSPVALAIRATASIRQFYVVNGGADGDVSIFTPTGTPASPSSLGLASSAQTIRGIAYDPTIDEVWLTTATARSAVLMSYNLTYGYEDEAISAGIKDPFGVAYNPSNDEVYVANGGSGKVTAYGYVLYGSQPTRDPKVRIVDPNGATHPAGIAFVY